MGSQLTSNTWNFHPIVKGVLALLFSGAVGYLTYTIGTPVLGLTLGLLVLALFILVLFQRPDLGMYTAVTLSFCMALIGRYIIKGIPLGFVVESIIATTYVIFFFKFFYQKTKFTAIPAKDIVLAIAIWMFFILLELANPIAPSREAWFYAMRGIALIPFMTIPLGMLLLRERRDLQNFLNLWMALSVFAVFWAIKQDIFGVSAAERVWLNNGAADTHIVFGQLRIFSFYIDAGTFGSGMGQIGTLSAILFLGPYSKRRKNIYLAVSLLAFYAMILSGTRGALVVPAVGGLAYIIMIRKFKYITLGVVVLILGFIFLNYTTVGHSNYDIRRMRSAMNTQDKSLMVRLANREKLTEYLKDKPFGGGVGSVGNFGSRFSPGTWLSQFPPDGLYTRIRAETGIVGYTLYIAVWLYILARAMGVCMRLKDSRLKNTAIGLTAAFAGILAGSYSNEVMIQFPNSLVTYLSISFIFVIAMWEKRDAGADTAGEQ